MCLCGCTDIENNMVIPQYRDSCNWGIVYTQLVLQPARLPTTEHLLSKHLGQSIFLVSEYTSLNS